MPISRSTIRKIAAAIGAVVLSPVLGQFFVSLAQGWGWYDAPSRKVAFVTDALSVIAANPWFHWFGGIVVGFVAGIWMIRLFPESTAKKNAQDHLEGWKRPDLRQALSEIHDATRAIDYEHPNSFDMSLDDRVQFYWNMVRNLAVSGKITIYGADLLSWKVKPIPVKAIETLELEEDYRALTNGKELQFISLKMDHKEIEKAIEIIRSEMRIATRPVARRDSV